MPGYYNIGKFDKNKNVLSLLEAVLSLKKEFPNLFLTLVGGGQENHNKVIGYCNKFPNTFSYLGKITDKKELCSVIRKNDLFVMPSHSENFWTGVFGGFESRTPCFIYKRTRYRWSVCSECGGSCKLKECLVYWWWDKKNNSEI